MFRDSNLRKRNFDMYDKLFKCINEAFRLLYQNDIHLIYNGPFEDKKIDINHHVGERSIVFRFAHYLQNLIIEDDELKEYNLDCEYNRNGAECKGLPSFPNGTYPDLIIHKRGSNEHNLLVMEFKTYWNKNRDEDIKKLIEFVDINGEYKYRYGISVLIEENRPECLLINPKLIDAVKLYLMGRISMAQGTMIAGVTLEEFEACLSVLKREK